MNNSLEHQLEILHSCGIRLLPGITINHLLESFPREAYESDTFILLLTTMGHELESEPYTIASNDIWHFDTECIEDHGDYATIARRFRDLADGSLPLENIDDYVDIEENEAWVSFELDGEDYKWFAEVTDDWGDPAIISQFAKLLANRNVGKRFTYLDLKGQDCLIGCSGAQQLEKLRRLTGLNFVWLV